jgi:hypothetical protein
MTYLGNPYHPWWLDNLAEDATSDPSPRVAG